MEHQARSRGAVAVEDIAQYGMTQTAGFLWRGGVHSQLMTSPGDGLKLDPSPISLAGHHAEMRLGGATLVMIDDLIRPIGEISAHGERNVALIDFNQAADEGDIAFLSFAKLKLHAQVAL